MCDLLEAECDVPEFWIEHWNVFGDSNLFLIEKIGEVFELIMETRMITPTNYYCLVISIPMMIADAQPMLVSTTTSFWSMGKKVHKKTEKYRRRRWIYCCKLKNF